MAEDFQGVIEELAKAIKKPMESRAPVVLAVQMIDKTGKVIKEKKGAAVAEAQREEEKREKKTVKLWERIAESLGGKKKLPGRDPKTGRFVAAGAGAGFLKSIMAGILPAGMIGMLGGASILGKLGIGAVVLGGIWAAIEAIGDGIKGIEWSKTMKVESESGFIGGFLGGKQKGGIWNAVANSMKGVGLGAITGLALGGPIGMIVGALLGGALFGIAGWFGGKAIAELIDPVVKNFKRLFGLSVKIDPEEMKKVEEEIKKGEKTKTDLQVKLAKLIDAKNKALSAAIPDQKLVDEITIEIAVLSHSIVEVVKKTKKNKTKQLEMERDEEKNALIAAEDAVKANEAEIFHLQQQKRRFQTALTMYGKDSIEGQNAAAQLAAISVKLRKTRAEGKKLREDEAAAEAVLLEEDRRLIKKAKEEGGTAPWRARFNVWTTDTWNSIKEDWMKLKTWAVTWFADNIFDPGSGPVGDFDSGTPMKILGVAIPSLSKVEIAIRLGWKKLKTWAVTWFADNIFDAGPPMKIFGFAIPSMEKIKEGIKVKWSTFKINVRTWYADNIFKIGPSGAGLSGAKIFGVAMPSMEKIKEGIKVKWSTFKINVRTWYADNIFDAGPPMKIFGFVIPSMEEVKKGIEVKWSKFKAGAIKWFADNIFDPGSAGGASADDAGSPMKIFGVALKLPNLDIKMPTAEELLAKLPEWMINPLAVIDRFVAFLTQNMPESVRKFLIDSPAEKLKKQLEKRADAAVEREKEIKKYREELKQSQLFIKTGGKEGKDTVANWGPTSRDIRFEKEALGSKQANIDKLIAQNKIQAADDKKFKEAALNKGSIFTHDQGIHDRLDRILPSGGGQVLNAQRSQQMLQAGIQRDMGGTAGGGGITSINTGGNVVSSPTTNYVNSGIAARRPIILAA